jgi:hypothetical protein
MSRQSRVPHSDGDGFAPRVVQRRSVPANSEEPTSSRRSRGDQSAKSSQRSRVPDADDSPRKSSNSRKSHDEKSVRNSRASDQEDASSEKSRSRSSNDLKKTPSTSDRSSTYRNANTSKMLDVIEGVIKKIDWNPRPITLTVSVRGHRNFEDIKIEVPPQIFCNAKPGDLIKTSVMKEKADRYIMIGEPQITIPKDRESVINTISRILPFEYKKGTYVDRDRIAEQLYNFIAQEAVHLKNYILKERKINHVILYLTDLAQTGDVEPLCKHGFFTPEQAKAFYREWIRQMGLRMLYVLGLTTKEINSSRSFLSRLLIKMYINPFTVPSIEIDKACKISKLLDRPVTETDRICGQIVRVLYNNVQKKGWSYTPYDEFNREYPELKKDLHRYREALETYTSIPGVDGKIYATIGYSVKFEEIGLYLQEQLNDLEDVVEYISTLMRVPDIPITISFKSRDEFIATPEQQMAIDMAIKKPISVITGGPGRGKTTCLEHLVKNIESCGRVPIIISAYGSAVSNVERRIKRKAYTIHRFISSLSSGYIPPFDHVIIDEASTMSMELFSMLIEELKKQRPIFWNKNGKKQYDEEFAFIAEEEDAFYEDNTSGDDSDASPRKILKRDRRRERDAMIKKFRKDYPITITLVGDVDQLPPIAAGQPFESIINSNFVPITVLTKNLRSEGLTIEENAQKIRNCSLDHFEIGDDFEIHDEGDDFFEEYLSELKSYLSLDEFQIVTPYNEPRNRINSMLQDIYYGSIKGEYELYSRGDHEPRKLFKVGDKVVVTANNYEAGIYNGNIGQITYIGNVVLKRLERVYDKLLDKYVVREWFHDEFSGNWFHTDGNCDDKKIKKKVPGFRAKFEDSSKEIEFPFFNPANKKQSSVEIRGSGRHAYERITSEEDEIVKELTSRIIDHAYIVTGHKCQGNEYKVVIIYLPPTKKHTNFLNHRLLYTMLTRAKLRVILIGNIRALEQAGRTPMPVRYDELEATLRAIIEGQEETEETEETEAIEGAEVVQLTDGTEASEPEFDEEALMKALENGEELTDEQMMFLARKTMTFVDDDYGEDYFD